MNAEQDGGVSFRFARGKLLALTAGSFAFAAACTFLLSTGAAPDGGFKEAVLYFGVPFFALCGVLGIKYLRAHGDAVVISPSGIMDTRISADTIPWPAVRSMTVREMRGQHFIMLDVDPNFERTMKLTRMAAWTKPMNAAIGFEGFAITVAGLDGSLEDLVAAIARFAPPGSPVT